VPPVVSLVVLPPPPVVLAAPPVPAATVLLPVVPAADVAVAPVVAPDVLAVVPSAGGSPISGGFEQPKASAARDKQDNPKPGYKAFIFICWCSQPLNVQAKAFRSRSKPIAAAR
jgi:hypothetical protein